MFYRINKDLIEYNPSLEFASKDDIVLGMDDRIPFGYSGTYPFLTKDGIVFYLFSDEFDRL